MLERLTGIKSKVMNYISCGSFGISLIFICIGFDKLLRYKNGDVYPYELHNAYVGGDAYNYIINGNYATGFFVLSGSFLITGTLFCGFYRFSGQFPCAETGNADQSKVKEEPAQEPVSSES